MSKDDGNYTTDYHKIKAADKSDNASMVKREIANLCNKLLHIKNYLINTNDILPRHLMTCSREKEIFSMSLQKVCYDTNQWSPILEAHLPSSCDLCQSRINP